MGDFGSVGERVCSAEKETALSIFSGGGFSLKESRLMSLCTPSVTRIFSIGFRSSKSRLRVLWDVGVFSGFNSMLIGG